MFLLSVSIANGTYTRESATGILVNDHDDDDTRYFTTQVCIPEQKTSH